MRKGFHSLAAQVQTVLQHDPYSGAIFLFRGRKGQRARFSIWFAFSAKREGSVSLASAIRTHVPDFAFPAWKGLRLHSHR
jgi:hypothetical protein